ncbi:M15 family metallopeptidase [Acuticoccus mangrovi]|uniref:M15 family metallopeptidase n=1 Tax=Acuticoccus mangrovi TaxID=2796142 RepID=A0A934MFS7_9HYPH|nr:M15 family metallopeptidase [Acuticoccus mangrovi]MBJ3774206.1 M15 family metallopeptidase [Acuticoccus mangrovi]
MLVRRIAHRFTEISSSIAMPRAVGVACLVVGLGTGFLGGALAQVPPRKPVAPNAATSVVRPQAPSGGGFLGSLFGGGGGGGGDAAGNKQRLLDAYPGAFRFEGNVLVFPSGERVVWDDGRRKSPAELLTDADVEDMFAYPYPSAREGEMAPPRDHDPGRIRSQEFFTALYGGSEGAVRRNVRTIRWVPSLGNAGLTVTTRFGIDDKLEKVSAELERLPKRFHKYLTPPGGGFLWRTIAGTRRLSVHSFGAAVDINTRFTNYWRWDKAAAGGVIPYRNQIPLEIVEVFERYCFIWGGRWYHYDTMHFEYRPELLPACRR